jgi:hypothetical protein
MNPTRNSELQWFDVIYEEIVREFKKKHGAELNELWVLLKGGTGNCLAPNWTKDDVAFNVSQIVTLQRGRYDKASFQQRLAPLNYSLLEPTLSYFESIKQGIIAAEKVSGSCKALLASLIALDGEHIDGFMTALHKALEQSKISVFRGDYMEILQTISGLITGVEACKIALILSTSQTVEKKTRGRPSSRYVSVGMDAARLWEDMTNRSVVTPKGHLNFDGKMEASQASTQFIHLVLKMVETRITLKETMTAIRHALPLIKRLQTLQGPNNETLNRLISRVVEQGNKKAPPRQKS